MTAGERRVIVASSLGTVFEWYDFYLYGSLAAVIARQFFSSLDPQAAFIFALLAFAAGFIVRPFGALVFGRLGDMIGRKYTFLVTIVIMGLSTFLVGLLPSYAAIGVAAPILLVVLRMLQGLALGGEYGGAATYVAEHAPAGRRGAWTAWIQTTATLGLLLCLMVILATRTLVGEEAFADWAWRIPFLLSILLLAISVWIRLAMQESPAFQRLKDEGRTSTAPLTESFARWPNLKLVLLALFGLVAGQAVVWYTGQFYALFFLANVLKVDGPTANILIAVALVIGTPFYLVFGALSDRIGRKPVIMGGLLLAMLSYFPLFAALTEAANPRLARAQAETRILVTADPAECSFQGSPLARETDFRSSCDIAKRTLAQAAASYETWEEAGRPATIRIGTTVLTAPRASLATGGGRFSEESAAEVAAFRAATLEALAAAGYPAQADPIPAGSAAWWRIVAILWLLVVYVAMVYGPIAAMLVELFPTRIRYTSMSLPYHVGNGWFGGLMPTIAFAMVAQNGNMYFGLWYPVGIAALTLFIGLLFVPETRGRDIDARGQGG
ncbi:MAG: MFS transporter [Chromatiales bacterium]|nr:MFS transporter [Chromatiales bacterium]